MVPVAQEGPKPTNGPSGARPRGVEWLGYSNCAEVRAMPLPRLLAHLKREISEKWAVPTLDGESAHRSVLVVSV